MVQRTLKMRGADSRLWDLSPVEIKGVLVMDMIAHNRDDARDIFQIAPAKREIPCGCLLKPGEPAGCGMAMSPVGIIPPIEKGVTRGSG
jgi:hypothetical protein